jgi:hypothetical protein
MTFAFESISLNRLPNTGEGTKGRYRKPPDDNDVQKHVTQDYKRLLLGNITGLTVVNK